MLYFNTAPDREGESKEDDQVGEEGDERDHEAILLQMLSNLFHNFSSTLYIIITVISSPIGSFESLVVHFIQIFKRVHLGHSIAYRKQDFDVKNDVYFFFSR